MHHKHYNKEQNNGILIYYKNKVIGKVIGNKFHKLIHFSRHALRQPPALALSIDSLKQAENAGAEWVEIFDVESKTTYKASIKHIRKVGLRIERGGFEPQLALGLDCWIIQTKDRGRQLNLFGE